jgi:glycosyltransferase involved in cell wall biosynthesis
MPVRNAAPYLTECLDSILTQTYINWELIAVNDHSTDESYTILQAYAQKDARITTFNNNGKGIIDALKSGYAASGGNYITRMDADDLMPLNKLKLMAETLDKNPKALITGKVKYIDNLGQGYIRYQNWLNKLIDYKSHYNNIYKECVVSSPCWMVTKSTFKQCLEFNSETYPEDYDLCFRFYENNIEIIGLKDVLHIWRDSETRASRNDNNYSDNSFIKIKVDYFLKLDYDPTKTMFLWGAGGKSKNVSKLIIQKDIAFIWGCNNPNKIGHNIYDKIMQNASGILDDNTTKYQAIITVANPEEQKEIKALLKNKPNIEAFWFC